MRRRWDFNSHNRADFGVQWICRALEVSRALASTGRSPGPGSRPSSSPTPLTWTGPSAARTISRIVR